MSTPASDAPDESSAMETIQPLRDNDTSIETDPAEDPAQAEWDQTASFDEGADPVEDAEIPAAALPNRAIQPETQGDNPVAAELGEEGQGDLAPEDL
ncbi:hypothetical protein FHX48_002285 [Microbacterium halimionae]|uniref:Sugar ABC transporter ATPase n=1 Tax=Microbacterium halimionae TaxID=1526413 RepID=A0A7W3JQJ6_9MICO|nr:sugar ABC transporter ATPase [Microbacterium halimionae]MBA8817187.1 hypothetical protein [Microbacterium halimionae]NII94637.1 hypothetical protein [Microbacterium halimionae]